MRTNLTYLCLALLVALAPAATSPVLAQEAVLAPGEPALTMKIVDDITAFYEWLLDAQMTEGQRRQVQENLVDSWQRGARDEMDQILEILALQASLSRLPEAERGLLHDLLQREVLSQLRARPADEGSRWALGIYDAAHPASADLEFVP